MQMNATLLDVTCCVRLHTRCMLLDVIGSCCANFETGQTLSHLQTDATTTRQKEFLILTT